VKSNPEKEERRERVAGVEFEEPMFPSCCRGRREGGCKGKLCGGVGGAERAREETVERPGSSFGTSCLEKELDLDESDSFSPFLL